MMKILKRVRNGLGRFFGWHHEDFARGQTCADEGDLPGAIRHFTRAIEIDPHYLEAYRNRARAWFRRGDYARAVADGTRALELHRMREEEFARAFFERGVAQWMMGERTQAGHDWYFASVIYPWDAAAWQNLAKSYIRTGASEETVGAFTGALRMHPDQARAHHLRGRRLLRQKDLRGAIAEWTEALAVDPRFADAWLDRARARRETGALEGAIEDLEMALVCAPASWPRRAAAESLLKGLQSP